jgi:hypothetical protein
VVILSNLPASFTLNGADTVTLSFTPENWSTEQTFLLQSISDANDTYETAGISFSVSGTTLIYNVTAIEPVTTSGGSSGVTNAFFLRGVPSEIAEGTSHTIYVSISVKSTENQTVTITINSPIFEVNGAASATLTFTTVNATVEQSFTVNALIDGNQTDETGTITLSYGSESTTLTIVNKDTAGSWLSIAAGSFVEGTKSSITAKLTQKPHSNVVVAFTSSHAELTIDNPELTFTSENWSTEQNLNLTGAIDANTVSETVTITGVSPGLTNSTTVQYLENGITITAGATSLIETQSSTVGVKLNRQPLNDVTVSLSANHSSISFTSTTFTFTSANWDTVQTSTVSSAAFTPDTAAVNTAPDPLVVTAASSGVASSTVNFRFQPIKEVYTWGTFTDNLNGTIRFSGIDGNFGGQAYTAQTLTFMKCSQGQVYDTTNHVCSGTASTFQYCPTNDSACDNGTIATGGPAYNTCDTLDYAGKTNWRLATKNELKTLIHCSNKTMPNDGSSCSSYTSLTVNKLFPNTVAYNYWSSSVGGSNDAWSVHFVTGSTGNNTKSYSLYIRCVLTGQ